MKDELTAYSQQLRKNGTKEENLLWFRYLRAYPVRFRRQHPIGPYIVDFYCARAKLVLELDGSQHYEPEGQRYDADRTRYLESLGLRVLRFSNLEVNRELRGVCQAIDLAVRERCAAQIRKTR